MPKLRKKHAQISLEYALIIACLVGALIAMQVYVQRALQGRFRQAAEQIGEQYEPGNTTGNFTTFVDKNISTVVDSHVPAQRYDEDTGGYREGFASQSEEFINWDITTRTGSETVGE